MTKRPASSEPVEDVLSIEQHEALDADIFYPQWKPNLSGNALCNIVRMIVAEIYRGYGATNPLVSPPADELLRMLSSETPERELVERCLKSGSYRELRLARTPLNCFVTVFV